jgi:uncharacterized protein YndB with AHSA1/START domain
MTKQVNAREFRMAAAAMKRPKAVADAAADALLASVEVAAPPERVFAALMTNEVERWWKHPGVYRLKDWGGRTFAPRAAGASASHSTTAGGSTNGARSARSRRRIGSC